MTSMTAAGSTLRKVGGAALQEPFLERWLLFSAVIFVLSAAAYAVRLLFVARSNNSPSRAVANPEDKHTDMS